MKVFEYFLKRGILKLCNTVVVLIIKSIVTIIFQLMIHYDVTFATFVF